MHPFLGIFRDNSTQKEVFSLEIHKKIAAFIENFKRFEQNNVLLDTFLNEYCYWFAVVLVERFSGGRIVYEPVEGHFIAQVASRYYDIRGDVTELYAGKELWCEQQCVETDSILREQILKEC